MAPQTVLHNIIIHTPTATAVTVTLVIRRETYITINIYYVCVCFRYYRQRNMIIIMYDNISGRPKREFRQKRLL